ncbi:MAG: phosphotransferase [Victivallales bacterium]|nr:phosphotransferase [Victivallales bacterium]
MEAQIKDKINAIVLAAGHGSRLAPLTDEIPKPLLPLGNIMLLEIILRSLRRAGVEKFAINTHHLGNKISDAVSQSCWRGRVVLYEEAKILGTGGPIVNAKELLSSSDCFILHNGDILTNLDFKGLICDHLSSGAHATMALLEGPENKVSLESDGSISDILGRLGAPTPARLLTYAGITAFSPEIFRHLPAEPVSCSVIEAILSVVKESPGKVRGYIGDCTGEKKNPFYWKDIGSPGSFLDASRDVASGAFKLPAGKPSMPLQMKPMPFKGASERVFFRISDGDESKVAMCSGRDTADFKRFVEIGKYLHSCGAGTPRIHSYSMDRHIVVMEDLGDDVLLDRIKGVSTSERGKLYTRVVRWLVDFQNLTYKDMRSVRAGEESPGFRVFNTDYLQWETSYFSENFLGRYCGLGEKALRELDCEFCSLAAETFSHPQVLIHRDFQATNIIFKEGSVRVVDFQGARIGSIAYDLMSLLKDPYAKLPRKLREELCQAYLDVFARSPLSRKIKFSRQEFARFAGCAGLQRSMQALGAYAFLGLTKGKKSYLRHIPKGLGLLREGLDDLDSGGAGLRLPKLKKTLSMIDL